MVWLHIAVWFLAAVSAYAALDVLGGTASPIQAHGKDPRGRGLLQPLTLGLGSAALVILGACLPMGATACLLLGSGLGGATYALLPILGLDAQPSWVRRGPDAGSRLGRRS